MMCLWLVLATLAALALAVQVPAVDNGDWHVDGQRTVLPVEGCTQFRSALLLHQGSAAMYRFNGTSVAVLGAVYEDGAEALIEFEGQQRRVNAQSRQGKCAEFARFSNLNAGALHTIRISVIGGGGRAVFPLIALDITPPAGSGPLPPGQPPAAPKPPDSPPNPAPPAHPTTNPLPTRPVTPIPSSTDDDEDDKPTSSTTRKPDDQKPTGSPGKGVNSGNDEEGDDESEDSDDGDQNSTLTEQPSNTADGESRPPLTVDSDTITSSNDSPAPSGSPDTSLNNSNESPSDTSSDKSSGPKASTLIPAILIPILILLALGAFAIWFIRRRRRTRLPPSAEWRMANPNCEAGGGYGSTDQMSEVPPWNPPAPSGYGADGRPWSPFQDDGRRH